MTRDWTREEFGITDNTPVVDIDSLEKKCERLQKQLEIAENILRELGYGYQSRSQYNKLISKANQYFEEQNK